MDRRGRELFEVGQSRVIRLQAHDAALQAPAHDLALSRKRRRKFSLFSWKPGRSRLLLSALAAGLAIGAVEETARRIGWFDVERTARALGFGIDQVTLEGHRFSFDRDIFDALDLANVRTFGALDTSAVKARIERLPWIDTAELTRVYPGRLDIRVTERTPFALWSRADQRYLIDRTGRVLSAVGGTELPDLPRVSGEGAAADAASLLEALARYPEVSARLEEAVRVSERRWTLKLSGATTLVLPADGEIGALEMLARDQALLRLVTAGRTTLDFRGPGRVAIRPAPPADATASAPPAGTGS